MRVLRRGSKGSVLVSCVCLWLEDLVMRDGVYGDR